jgi:hypothetical protein
MNPDYFVRWRNYSEFSRVLEYDPQRGVLTPTPFFDPHLERIVTDTEVAFLIDGEYILFLQTNGILETGLISTRIVPNEFPRLEFCRQEDSVPEVLAAASREGILRAPDFREDEFDPSQDDCFNFFDTIQFSRSGVVAARINEIQLIADDAGSYLDAHDGELLLSKNYGIPIPPLTITHLLVDGAGNNVSTDDTKLIVVKP